MDQGSRIYRNGNICCFLCEHKNAHNISRVEQENVKTIDELLKTVMTVFSATLDVHYEI